MGSFPRNENFQNTEALEYCPIVYVSDEVMLWNNDYIPMEYYKRIQPYKSIRKATIHHDGGELEFYKMPVVGHVLILNLRLFSDRHCQRVACSLRASLEHISRLPSEYDHLGVPRDSVRYDFRCLCGELNEGEQCLGTRLRECTTDK